MIVMRLQLELNARAVYEVATEERIGHQLGKCKLLVM